MTELASTFWSRVESMGTNDVCWCWNGCLDCAGYGRLGGKLAHRIAFELSCGKIPDGLCVLHRCDNRRCCNPAHLFLGTQADNVADMLNKHRGVSCPGERNGRAKLTSSDVREIRLLRMNGRTQRSLAERFGVTRTLVRMIERGSVWRNLTDFPTDDRAEEWHP